MSSIKQSILSSIFLQKQESNDNGRYIEYDKHTRAKTSHMIHIFTHSLSPFRSLPLTSKHQPPHHNSNHDQDLASNNQSLTHPRNEAPLDTSHHATASPLDLNMELSPLQPVIKGYCPRERETGWCPVGVHESSIQESKGSSTHTISLSVRYDATTGFKDRLGD